jgi:hypothetical protein
MLMTVVLLTDTDEARLRGALGASLLVLATCVWVPAPTFTVSAVGTAGVITVVGMNEAADASRIGGTVNVV